MPLMRLKLEAIPPGLRVEAQKQEMRSVPQVDGGQVDLRLDEASLGIDVLNPRQRT